MARFTDKITETQRKIQMQTKSLSKISANVALLMPVSQTSNPYAVNDDEPYMQFDSPSKNIKLKWEEQLTERMIAELHIEEVP